MKKSIIMFCILLSVLMSLPIQSKAAETLVNDNHTDSKDYCLKANDVEINLSEIVDKSEEETQEFIIEYANFRFYYRVNGWPLGEVAAEDILEIDFSEFQREATKEGYVIRVVFRERTEGEYSAIEFRVFVNDDLPPKEPEEIPDPKPESKPEPEERPESSPEEKPQVAPEVEEESGDRKEQVVKKQTKVEVQQASIESLELDEEKEEEEEPVIQEDVLEVVVPILEQSPPSNPTQPGKSVNIERIVGLGLVGVGTTATATLFLSILGDLRLLSWYAKKKRQIREMGK